MMAAVSQTPAGRIASLSASEQTRLVRILAMLSSPHEGERAAAGFLATAFIRKHGLMWGHLTALLCPLPDSRPAAPTERRRSASPSWRGYCRRRLPKRGQSVNCLS